MKICFFLHVGLSIISIAQNFNNLKSCARKRIPKHAGLRMSLRNSLRSTEFITLLNNLGCCFSYDDILRVDTKWANALPENDDSYTKVLKNIISGYFTQASANNAHYVQEAPRSTLETLFCINVAALGIRQIFGKSRHHHEGDLDRYWFKIFHYKSLKLSKIFLCQHIFPKSVVASYFQKIY